MFLPAGRLVASVFVVFYPTSWPSFPNKQGRGAGGFIHRASVDKTGLAPSAASRCSRRRTICRGTYTLPPPRRPITNYPSLPSPLSGHIGITTDVSAPTLLYPPGHNVLRKSWPGHLERVTWGGRERSPGGGIDSDLRPIFSPPPDLYARKLNDYKVSTLVFEEIRL